MARDPPIPNLHSATGRFHAPPRPFSEFMSFGCPDSRSGFRISHSPFEEFPIFFVSFVSFCGRFPHSAFCLLPSAFGYSAVPLPLQPSTPLFRPRQAAQTAVDKSFLQAQSSPKQEDLGREKPT